MTTNLPDRVVVDLPAGCKALLRFIADRHGITLADLMREYVANEIGVDGVEVPAALEEIRPALSLAERTAHDDRSRH